MSVFSIFERDCSVGDQVSISLISGRIVKGKVIEIGNLIRIEEDNGHVICLLDSIIGGWSLSNKRSASVEGQSEECNVEEMKRSCLQAYKDVFQGSEISPRSLVQVNATYVRPSEYASTDLGVADTKDGSPVFIRRQGFVGDPSVHLKNGSQLYVKVRSATADSVESIGFMTFNSLNQYYASSIKKSDYHVTLAILHYLMENVDELTGKQDEISAIVEKVECLMSKDVIFGRNLAPKPWFWPYWLKDYIKSSVESERQGISDEELQSLFFERFGIGVSKMEIYEIREGMGLSGSSLGGDESGIQSSQNSIMRKALLKQKLNEKLKETFLTAGVVMESKTFSNAELVDATDGRLVRAKMDDGLVIDAPGVVVAGNSGSLYPVGTRVYIKPSQRGAYYIIVPETTYDGLFDYCRDCLNKDDFHAIDRVVNVLLDFPELAVSKDSWMVLSMELKSVAKMISH